MPPQRTVGELWALVLCAVLVPGAPAQAARAARAVEPPAGHVALASAPAQITELRLPFAGAWGVIQGMDSGDTHVGYAAFALDFAPAEPLTPARFRTRRTLQEHPCYGSPILAPANGVVVWVRDGARDWPPFRPPRRHDAGNFVILRHAPGEYTEMRHLQRASIAVKLGDRVRAGDIIGRCGNSGDATTPHLHLGLLGSMNPIATRPMRFSHYQVLASDGKWRPGDGTPRSGQVVRPVPTP